MRDARSKTVSVVMGLNFRLDGSGCHRPVSKTTAALMPNQNHCARQVSQADMMLYNVVDLGEGVRWSARCLFKI